MKVKLDSLFIAAQQSQGNHRLFESIMQLIFRLHGGLSMCFQKRYGMHLEPYEMLGYSWQALPTAIKEFDPSKGKASTCWGLVVRRITTAQRDTNIYVGAVKVGIKVRKRYQKVGFDGEISGQIDRDYSMMINDSAMISSDCLCGSNSEGE